MKKPAGASGVVLCAGLVLLVMMLGMSHQAFAITSSIVINTEARTVNDGTSVMFSGQITVIDEQGPRGLAYAEFQIMDELTREIIYTGQADSDGMYSFYWTASQLGGMSTRTLKAIFPGTYYYPYAENLISVTVYAQPDIHKPVVDKGLDVDLSDYDIIIWYDGHQKDCWDCYSNSHLFIAQGDSLSWFNNDDRQHKIRITGPDDAAESPILKRNKSFSHKFYIPGQYSFVCTIHPWATGTIEVEPYAKERQEIDRQSSERTNPYLVHSGDFVTLSGLFSGFENPQVFWNQISGISVELSDPYSLEPTFVAPTVYTRNVEPLVFEFTVTDTSGQTIRDTIQVSVLPSNSSPVADAGYDQTVEAGDTITLEGSGYDSDGDDIYYIWSQIGGPDVDLIDSDMPTAQFTVPHYSGSDPLVFELTVSDDFGGSGSDTVEINTAQYSNSPQSAQQTEKSGCLIATAAFGTELAPQVQTLREIRQNVLFSTGSGTAFMAGFNEFYYSFSPAVADLERQSPIFREIVKTIITPLLSTLSILNYVEIESEHEMLGYGIGIILLNVAMYFVIPSILIINVRRYCVNF